MFDDKDLKEIAFNAAVELTIAQLSNSQQVPHKGLGKDIGDMFNSIYSSLLQSLKQVN
ncbi:MAG: hypothetical protein HXO49_03660 [Prevotella sp.]|nr:hypothetical protein [Prevotella sp.]